MTPHDTLHCLVPYSDYGYEVIYPSILRGTWYCIVKVSCTDLYKCESVMHGSSRRGERPPPENSNSFVLENRHRIPSPEKYKLYLGPSPPSPWKKPLEKKILNPRMSADRILCQPVSTTRCYRHISHHVCLYVESRCLEIAPGVIK